MQTARTRRFGRVSESIARRIKKQISDGALLPGEKLPAERDMAQRYRTSRVSVREAYRSLEELGLLTIRRGAEGGAFITDLDHGPVMRSLSLMLRLGKTTHEEITEARLLIEPPIARLAARRAHPGDLERLDYVVNQQELALERRGARDGDWRQRSGRDNGENEITERTEATASHRKTEKRRQDIGCTTRISVSLRLCVEPLPPYAPLPLCSRRSRLTSHSPLSD